MKASFFPASSKLHKTEPNLYHSIQDAGNWLQDDGQAITAMFQGYKYWESNKPEQI